MHVRTRQTPEGKIVRKKNPDGSDERDEHGMVIFFQEAELKWEAVVEDGPWYDDSNPEAPGRTEREAVDNVLTMLKTWRDECTELLKSHGKE